MQIGTVGSVMKFRLNVGIYCIAPRWFKDLNETQALQMVGLYQSIDADEFGCSLQDISLAFPIADFLDVENSGPYLGNVS